jgi:hypothetical protein
MSKAKSIRATEKAVMVCDALDSVENVRLTDYKWTAELEKLLDKVAAGEDPLNIIDEVLRDFGIVFQEIDKNKEAFEQKLGKGKPDPDNILGSCPKCDGKLVLEWSKRKKKSYVRCDSCKEFYPTWKTTKKQRIVPTTNLCPTHSIKLLRREPGKHTFCVLCFKSWLEDNK